MGRPPLFRDLSLEAAGEAARAEGKCLLVDVTGEHCPPCRQMDKSTWRAPEVEEWVAGRAVAVQLAQEDPAVEPLSIMAVPTLLVFRDGRELDRTEGALAPAALLEWLEGALQGKTVLDRLRAAAPHDLQARLQLAHTLVLRARFDEATTEFVWLWEHALDVDPNFIGVRFSFLLSQIAHLLACHPPARESFVRLRDEAGRALASPPMLSDWLALNELLRDEDRVLSWFDGVKDALPAGLALHRNHRFVELLERHDRWADLGRLVDPLADLRDMHRLIDEAFGSVPEGMPAEFVEEGKAFLGQQLRRRAANLCRAMSAAGRAEASQATAAEARRLDPSPEMDAALRESGA